MGCIAGTKDVCGRPVNQADFGDPATSAMLYFSDPVKELIAQSLYGVDGKRAEIDH